MLIYIHGGGWSGESRNEFSKPMEFLFSSLNFVSVSIDYRSHDKLSGLNHPTHIKDIAKAIKWVYDNIEMYGGDENYINLLGWSAGANLAALAVTNQGFIKSDRCIKKVILLDSGPYLTLELGLFEPKYNFTNMFYNNFGRDSLVYADCIPSKNVLSSNQQILPEFLLAFESQASLLRIKPNKAFFDLLIKKGHKAKLLSLDLTHTEFISFLGIKSDSIPLSESIRCFFK